MRTSKPFSTITYNSPDFLKKKMNELISSGDVSFWCFIKHKAEIDEKKDHIHLYVVPAGMMQTDCLKLHLQEPDPDKAGQFLTCISARSSKTFDDWYLYSLHDTRYLASKGQSRQHKYSRDVLVCSDTNELDCLINEIDMIKYTVYQTLIEYLQDGKTFDQLLLSGQVPIQQVRNFAFAWEVLSTTIKRNEPTHTPKEIEDKQTPLIDSTTGEYIGNLEEFIDII